METTNQQLSATPRPWIATGDGYICTNGYGSLPLCSPFTHKAHRDKFGGPTPEAKANAALIVRAVNAHDELVAALTRLLDHCTQANKDYDATTAARAALAKAID